MSQTTEKPDITRIPKFEGIHAWMKKLEDWADAMWHECEHLRDDLAESRGDVAQIQEEMTMLRIEHDALIMDLEDIPRGIRTLDEVLDRARRTTDDEA